VKIMKEGRGTLFLVQKARLSASFKHMLLCGR